MARILELQDLLSKTLDDFSAFPAHTPAHIHLTKLPDT